MQDHDPPPRQRERQYTLREAAAVLNISYRTMRRRVLAGEIGYIRVGNRSVRFTDAQLQDYIERRTFDASLAV